MIDIIKAEMRRAAHHSGRTCPTGWGQRTMHIPAPCQEVKSEVRDGGTSPELSRLRATNEEEEEDCRIARAGEFFCPRNSQ